VLRRPLRLSNRQFSHCRPFGGYSRLLGSCQIAGSLIEEPIGPEMPASVYKSNPPDFITLSAPLRSRLDSGASTTEGSEEGAPSEFVKSDDSISRTSGSSRREAAPFTQTSSLMRSKRCSTSLSAALRVDSGHEGVTSLPSANESLWLQAKPVSVRRLRTQQPPANNESRWALGVTAADVVQPFGA
jgi:hypothetical protein